MSLGKYRTASSNQIRNRELDFKQGTLTFLMTNKYPGDSAFTSEQSKAIREQMGQLYQDFIKTHTSL